MDQQENDLKELLLEHDQLRKEILHNEVLNTQILTATLIVVSALMGFAFSETIPDLTVKGILFFIAEIVALIGILQSTDRGRITFMIASYLRTFTEPQLRQLKWETRLMDFRQHSPRQGYGEFIANNLWIYMLIAIANFGLGGWHILQGFQGSIGLYGIIVFLVLWLLITIWLVWTGWSRYNQYVFKHRETFDPIWAKIRDEEEPEVSA